MLTLEDIKEDLARAGYTGYDGDVGAGEEAQGMFWNLVAVMEKLIKYLEQKET